MKQIVLLLMLALSAFAVDGSTAPPSPVPEPASIVLMGAGLAAVAYAGWRRNRKQ